MLKNIYILGMLFEVLIGCNNDNTLPQDEIDTTGVTIEIDKSTSDSSIYHVITLPPADDLHLYHAFDDIYFGCRYNASGKLGIKDDYLLDNKPFNIMGSQTFDTLGLWEFSLVGYFSQEEFTNGCLNDISKIVTIKYSDPQQIEEYIAPTTELNKFLGVPSDAGEGKYVQKWENDSTRILLGYQKNYSTTTLSPKETKSGQAETLVYPMGFRIVLKFTSKLLEKKILRIKGELKASQTEKEVQQF